MAEFDKQPWSRSISRGTQHFGREYLYRPAHHMAKSLDNVYEWNAVMQHFREQVGQAAQSEFNQGIANRYRKGQSIAPHIDSQPCFGPCIATLSLGTSMVMRFSRPGKDVDVALHSGDLVILKGDARNIWRHSLLASNDPNFLRVSLTFRSVLPSAPEA